MTRIGISVEGQTEEAFVKSLLEEHLRDRQVTPTPVLIGSARGELDRSLARHWPCELKRPATAE